MTVTRTRTRHPFAIRHLTVEAVTPLTETMVRITLTGDLSGFTSTGPADHVKVFFPDGAGVLRAPQLEGDRIVRDPDATYISRDYTPLNWTETSLDLDFVLHGDTGPASAWAARAGAGDPLVVAGPRGSKSAPEGADWWLLCADATALPSLGRWLADAPAGLPVRALVFADTDTLADYPLPEGADVDWVLTTDDPEPVVRALDLDSSPDFAGTGFIWAAGEATSLIGVRRYLRRELGLPGGQVAVDGYWRRGEADADHHAPIDPSDPEE
ncbi:siderophore-interacting protein [Pseudactinotalea sp. HY158]|uniref:siderophore-interacting protein n=1 Tax=unclassified Pseudactinotalea TaxID=2649176 RepID=UPI001E421074|nr:siderophore-interacting protein [Pseudactinotalea sp. HY158]